MVKVVTLMKTVIWHDRGSETVRQRLKDADEARELFMKLVPEVLNIIKSG